MSVPIPLRRDFSAPQLRGLAKKTKDGPQNRRLLTLAAIYDSASRTAAAKIGGVGLQIVRDYEQAAGAIETFKKTSPRAWTQSRARRRSTATI